MKIAIDLLSTIPGRSGATGFWRNMLKLLPRLDSTSEYFVFVTSTLERFYRQALETIPNNLQFVPAGFREETRFARLSYQEMEVPKFCRAKDVDLHFTCNPVPLFMHLSAKEVWKITSFQHLFFPEQLGAKRALYLKYAFRRKASRSRVIIANSQYSKRVIVERSRVEQQKVVVIYESLDHSLFNLDGNIDRHAEYLARSYSVTGPFILSVSDIRPYKNPISLIRAFALLVRSESIPHRLVMIGNDYRAFRQQVQQIAFDEGVDGLVLYFDALPQEELVPFYRCADAFVYPSSLETFGIPPLEAMACGTPVIASNESSIPEIAGEGALLVNPKDIDGLASAIWAVLSDQSLAANLTQKGLERIQTFSWEKNAAQTIQLLKDIVNS